MKTIKKVDRQGWSLDEFVELLNSQLGETENSATEASDDERFRQELSARNLRRLAAEGAMDAPDRFGREARYGERHLRQAMEARALMSRGFTCSSIRALRAASSSSSDPLASGSRALSDSLSEPAAFSAPQSGSSLTSASSLSSHWAAGATEAPSAARATAFLDSLNSKTETARDPDASRTLAGSLGSSYLGASPAYAKRLMGSIANAEAPAPSAQPTFSSPSAGASSVSLRAMRSMVEAEPFEGLRISVRAHNAPLTDHMKAQALEALQIAWERARNNS